MPKVSTLNILRILKQRVLAYAKRLDDLRGQRGSRVGCNPNVLLGSWLDKAIECSEQIEAENVAFTAKTGIEVEQEHGETKCEK